MLARLHGSEKPTTTTGVLDRVTYADVVIYLRESFEPPDKREVIERKIKGILWDNYETPSAYYFSKLYLIKKIGAPRFRKENS